MLSLNTDSVISSFPIYVSFISFSWFITLARPSNMWAHWEETSLMSGRTLNTGYQCQGRSPTTWRIAKIITMKITRNRSPNTSTHFHSTILGNGVAKENITQSNTRWNNNFTYMEKRQRKISSNCVHWFPVASGSHQAANTGQLACMHASCAVAEGHLFLLRGVWNKRRLESAWESLTHWV